MSYLRMFAPWIVYAVITGESAASKQWAALAALLLMGVSLALQLRRGHTPQALIIEIGSVVFFAAVAVLAWTIPDNSALRYTQAAASAALAVIAWLSLAVGHPFTLGIAKQSVPAEYWAEPLFIRTNQIITLVWATAFVAQAAALAVATAAHAGTLAMLVIQIVGLAAPAVFTVRYTTIVQARAESTADPWQLDPGTALRRGDYDSVTAPR